jgi:hypothetical protein
VDERRCSGCILLPGGVAVSGWEAGYQLGPRGLVLVNWAAKVGCSLGQAGTRSGLEMDRGNGLHVGNAKWAGGEKDGEWAGRRELAQKV